MAELNLVGIFSSVQGSANTSGCDVELYKDVFWLYSLFDTCIMK